MQCSRSGGVNPAVPISRPNLLSGRLNPFFSTSMGAIESGSRLFRPVQISPEGLGRTKTSKHMLRTAVLTLLAAIQARGVERSPDRVFKTLFGQSGFSCRYVKLHHYRTP